MIHANPTWAASTSVRGRECGSCHAAAACTACHEDPDMSHTEHAWDIGLGTYWPDAAPTGEPFGSGTSNGNEKQRNINSALTCSNAKCHEKVSGTGNAPVMVENYGSGISYTGTGWSMVGLSGATANNYSRSNYAGAKATYAFSGEKVEFISMKHPYFGKATVSIDGEVEATIDLYAPSIEKQALVYTSGLLSSGPHTITVEVLHQKNDLARDYYVAIDAFKVYPKLTTSLSGCIDCHAPDDFSGTEIDRTGAHANPAAHLATETAGSISTTSTVRASVSCTSVCHVNGIDAEHASVIATSSPAELIDGRFSCVECHTDAKFVPFAAPGVGDWGKTCAECHAVRHDAFGAKHDFTATSRNTCGLEESCHNVANVDRLHHNATTTPNPAVNNNCNVCHTSDGRPVGTISLADATQCTDCHTGASHGSAGSHRIHTNASDPRGPGGLVCSDCHDTNAYPRFKTGTDEDSDGRYDLSETDVCDPCHSPGGSYDGVDSDTAPSGAISVGAKTNWDAQVYESTSTLQAGKERWCVGCHDSSPATIDGVQAPPVAGDESSATAYGTGYGFYTSGHGVPASDTLPSNGSDPGPDCTCDSCHEFSRTHMDGIDRTFTSAGTPTTYRNGYRLDSVNGSEPMTIPWTGGAAPNGTEARLCYRCHSSGPAVNSPNNTSNFRSSTYASGLHWFHMGITSSIWAPDWRGSQNSRPNCPTCHNVHGSKRLAMIRDGELESDYQQRRPGVRIWYKKGSGGNISSWYYYNVPAPHEGVPSPQGITLPLSDGWVWEDGSVSNVCNAGCHTTVLWLNPVTRSLYKSYPASPTLDWTGETTYADDGSRPDSGPGDPGFTFRVKYADANNDPPSYVRLRIDRNDDGDFMDPGEITTMTADVLGDTSCYDGVLYHTDPVVLGKAGDDVLSYCFEASDGARTATGPELRTVSIVNAAPTLPWTGEAGYASDGVDPNVGEMDSASFEFRITYKDTDGEAPVGGVSLFVDKNDDGDCDDADEVVAMNDLGDPSYALGKRYACTTTLGYGVDGRIDYHFAATDGTDTANTETEQVTVTLATNSAPVLAWTAESTTYAGDGADPDRQAARKPFYFRVKYADANNDAPNVKQVMVDLDDNGSYEASEAFAMDDAAGSPPNDGDYTNGEVFAKRVYVPNAHDGTLEYCFDFSDAHDATATGVQGVDRTLQAFDARDVGPGGPPTYDYSTIQAAVNAAADGDTILVSDGSYAGFAYGDKRVTVESINGSALTTISGGATVVNFNYSYLGNEATLTGFTVTGGTSCGIQTSVGGSAASKATVTDCVIRNNAKGVSHAGYASFPIVVDRCTIRNNTGVGFQSTDISVVTLRDTTLSANGARGAYFYGGDITVTRCTVVGNSGAAGAGMYFTAAGGPLTSNISDTLVATNTSTGYGGGIYYVAGNDANTVNRTIVRGNSASSGGGISQESGTVTYNDCIVEGNTATADGGGCYFICGPGTSTMNRCYIRGNWAKGGTNGGGGVYHPNAGTYTYTDCTFSGNKTNGNGGGAWVGLNTNMPTRFTNCTFSGNKAVKRAGGIYCGPASSGSQDVLKVWNCVLYGDIADAGGCEEMDGSGTSDPAEYRYAWVRNTGMMQETAAFFHQSGNTAAYPMFVTPVDASLAPTSAGDYHLQSDSQCIDAAEGTIAPTDDIDGDPRPDGSGYDMGSDEVAGAGGMAMSTEYPGTEFCLGDRGWLPEVGALGSRWRAAPAGPPLMSEGSWMLSGRIGRGASRC